MQEWILPYYLYCLSGLSDAGQTLCPPIHNIYQLTGCSVQLFDWLECTELAWFLSKEFSGWIFQKLESIFLESIVCVWTLFPPSFWQSLWLLDFQALRTQHLSRLSVYLQHIAEMTLALEYLFICTFMMTTSQKGRSWINQLIVVFLHNPNSFGRFSSPCHGWLLGNYQ